MMLPICAENAVKHEVQRCAVRHCVAGVSVAGIYVEHAQPDRLHGVQPRVQEHVSEAAALRLLCRRRRLQASEPATAAGPPEPVPHQRQCHARLETACCSHVIHSRIASPSSTVQLSPFRHPNNPQLLTEQQTSLALLLRTSARTELG